MPWHPALVAQGWPLPSCRKDPRPALWTDPGTAPGSSGPRLMSALLSGCGPARWMGVCLLAAAVQPGALRPSLQDTAGSRGQARAKDEVAASPPARVLPAGGESTSPRCSPPRAHPAL